MASDATPETASAVKPSLRARASGIYRITNTANGKVYIGSSVNVPKRLHQHKRDLLAGKHCNPFLQRAWRRHTQEQFVFEAIEDCSADDLITREQAWIDSARSADEQTGYNICRTAYTPGSHPRSDIHRARIGAANKGKKHSPETCALLAARIYAPDFGAKISASRRASSRAQAANLATNAAKRTLTDAEVQEIVRLRRVGTPVHAIASRFGLTRRPIRAILGGETYTHITGLCRGEIVRAPRRERKPRLPNPRKPPRVRAGEWTRADLRTLSAEAVHSIRSDSAAGLSIAKLAAAHGTSLCTIQRVIHRQTYADVL